MGLYLCVFDVDEEVEGVEVGGYADFGFLRSNVIERLEGGIAGSKFPKLINHSDSDGEWSPDECVTLRRELKTIAEGFRRFPAVPFLSEWQWRIADLMGSKPASLCDSLIDVDGEPLLERLIEICDVAIKRDCPILFQ